MPHTYQPLRRKGEFRLIELQPSINDDDILDCRLTIRRIPGLGTNAEPFEYEAVSYVWGTELSARPVLVDGWERQIGQNLWDFLHQARKTFAQGSRLFWIDALCIDQTNLAERNVQVLHMGAIYRAATRTIVWLGTGDVDVTLAMTYVGESVSNADAMFCGGTGDDDYMYLLTAIHTWLHLPYWTRTWVVQEFLISPEVLLVYGTYSVPVRATLLFMKSLTEVTKTKTKPKPRTQMQLQTKIDSRGVIQSLLVSPGASLLLQRLSQDSRTTLAGLIIKNQYSRCLEPRDKIYAVLSLVEDRLPIVVDYGSDIRSVFRDVLYIWAEQVDSASNLLSLGSLLAKVLHLSTKLLDLPRDAQLTMTRASSTAALSTGRGFPVNLYAVGRVDCHTVIDVTTSRPSQEVLSVELVDQVIQSDPRFATWIRRFIQPEDFKRMINDLVLGSRVAAWLHRFWLTSRRTGILSNLSVDEHAVPDRRSSMSLVGVSFSMLKSPHYAIGLALGNIQLGDPILQALCHEVMFVCTENDQGKGMQRPSKPTAVLICARSGEPGLDPLTHRSMPFVATISEAEFKSPPVSSGISFTVQEMLALCVE